MWKHRGHLQQRRFVEKKVESLSVRRQEVNFTPDCPWQRPHYCQIMNHLNELSLWVMEMWMDQEPGNKRVQLFPRHVWRAELKEMLRDQHLCWRAVTLFCQRLRESSPGTALSAGASSGDAGCKPRAAPFLWEGSSRVRCRDYCVFVLSGRCSAVVVVKYGI